MMDVGALRNASIRSGAGFGTLIMAVVTLMQMAPLYNFGLRSSARWFARAAAASSAVAFADAAISAADTAERSSCAPNQFFNS